MKTLSKNMVLSFVAKFVTILTGIVTQRYILLAYGSTFNGLTSSISQVMSYLVLLEAGLGTASIQALYSPLTNNEWGKISSIFVATGHAYRKISVAFTSMLVLVSLILPFAVANEVEYCLAALLTLIIGGGAVVSYIFGGKYKVLLMADRKIYVLHYFDIFCSIISCVLRICALLSGKSIVFVQLINLATVLMRNAGFFIYVKKKYLLLDYAAKPDEKSIEKRWNVLIHQVTGLIVNHTDIVILTLFSSLKLVSVYSVYNMVFGQLNTLIQSTFLTAPQASFGKLFNSNREKFDKLYRIYENTFIILLSILGSISLTMITPFITIYTAGVNDITYIDQWLPVLFTLILFMNLIRCPAVMMINIAGAFQETQRGAIMEAVINLSVSLSLFFLTPLGIYGLLIGTVCSFLYRSTDIFIFIYHNIIRKSMACFICNISVNLFAAILLYIIFVLVNPISCTTFFEWFYKACGVSLITIAIYLLTNMLLNRKNLFEILSFAKKLLNKKEVK